MENGTQLNENGIQSDTVWLHDFRDVVSVTRTQMCSLKVPTAASCCNGFCNGPAALFKTMWTRYGSFGKLEVFDDLSESDRSIDDKKLVFCDERGSRTFYKQNAKRISTALQLLEENSDVATENDLLESRPQNIPQLLSSTYKSIPMGCIEITEHKGRNFPCRNVGSSLYLLNMMMDDLTMFQEEQIQNKVMGRLENEFCLICPPHGQSILMKKCVAEQILENWLRTFLTYLEFYSLDVDAIMEAE